MPEPRGPVVPATAPPAVVAERARLLLDVLRDPALPAPPPAPAGDALAARLSGATTDEVWLTLATLSGVLPTWHETLHASRVLRSDGPRALRDLLVPRAHAVEVVTDAVLLDVTDEPIAVDELGAAEVTQVLLGHWEGLPGVRRVRRSEDGTRLVPADAADDATATTLVPWRCTLVVLRAPTDADTASRVRALADHARCRTAALGFGEPAVVANDRSPGEAAGAAHALSALRHFTCVAALSPVAHEQYLGWRDMIRTLDLPGPDVVPVEPADAAPEVSDAVRAEVRATFDPGPLPLVVSTGGLGPRGNQLLVLRAANTLWRSGAAFQLVLLGDRRETSPELAQQVDRLRTAGYPVAVVRRLGAERTAALVEASTCLVDVPLHDPVGYHAALARALRVPVVALPRGARAVTSTTGTADPDDSTALAVALGAALQQSAQRVPWTLASAADPRRPWHVVADELWRVLAPAPVLTG